MLGYPLLWVVISAYYFSSMKDKYPTLYVSSSCLSTILHFTNKNEYEVEGIPNILWENSDPKSNKSPWILQIIILAYFFV